MAMAAYELRLKFTKEDVASTTKEETYLKLRRLYDGLDFEPRPKRSCNHCRLKPSTH